MERQLAAMAAGRGRGRTWAAGTGTWEAGRLSWDSTLCSSMLCLLSLSPLSRLSPPPVPSLKPLCLSLLPPTFTLLFFCHACLPPTLIAHSLTLLLLTIPP